MLSLKFLVFIFLLTLGIPRISPIYAQNPPAKTYQPGFWQPVTRFDIKRPVEVNIINNTDIPIEYDLTDSAVINPQSLQPAKTGILKGFGSSANIVIYSLVKNTADFSLRFEIAVREDSNTVDISVVKDEPSFIGHRSVNLQNTGAIYVY